MMSTLEDYINVYQPWYMRYNLALNFNLSTVNCWPSLLKHASVWRDKGEENMNSHYRYYSFSSLRSTVSLHNVCVACRFSCWIQEMVPKAPMHSPSLNRDMFSGTLDNSWHPYVVFFLLLSCFVIFLYNYASRPYLESYFFTPPPTSRVKDY